MSLFPFLGVSGVVFNFYFKQKFLSNSEDTDQMLHSLASDLGLHCLPRSYLRDARQISVNH